MAATVANIWHKRENKDTKEEKHSLSSIMTQQLIESENEQSELTKDLQSKLTKDLQDLVDEGLLTKNEALMMVSQEDKDIRKDEVEETVNKIGSNVTISSDLQTLLNQGIISLKEAQIMMTTTTKSIVDQGSILANTQGDAALAKAMQLDEDLQAKEQHEEAARQSNRKHRSLKISFATSLKPYSEHQRDEHYYDYDEESDNFYGMDGIDETVFNPWDINKHSAKVSGRRNMKRLEKNTMSNSLGKLSDDTTLNNNVYNSLNEWMKKQGKSDGRGFSGRNSKEQRKTKQGAFDARTKHGLLKLINRGIIDNVSSILRVGKEAVVCKAYGYGSNEINGIDDTNKCNKDAANSSNNQQAKQFLAVKLFFTTLSDFKNRAEYVDGDPRYHNSHFSDQKYSASLKIWAEKEFRNYKRIEKAGIQCPKPYCVIDSTLITSLIHTNGHAAKQLREVLDWTPKKLRRYYVKAVLIMKNMYKSCKLVHADLSEYNLIVNKQEMFVIDVGQAVDIHHPKSLQYLKRDIKVITNFFNKVSNKINANIGILDDLVLYDFIVYESNLSSNYMKNFNEKDDNMKNAVRNSNKKHIFNKDETIQLLKSIMESNL